MSIAVTGANGQLGSSLVRRLGERCVPLTRRECDMSSSASVLRALDMFLPDVVINCAAFTNVDLAEQEADLCMAINADAVQGVATWCAQHQKLLVQISSDYVFGNECDLPRPWTELDVPRPRCVYATSKLLGEHYATSAPCHLIVRTCGLYGANAKSNFVDTMRRLAMQRDRLRVVVDQRCTPTYVEHLVTAVIDLIDRTWDRRKLGRQELDGEPPWGVYHLTNSGETCWSEFAREIFHMTKLNVFVEEITSQEYGAAAIRPSYSVLDHSKYVTLGGATMPHWRDALHEYLRATSTPSDV